MVTEYEELPAVPYFMQTAIGSTQPQIAYTAAEFRAYTAAIMRRTGVLGSSDFVCEQSPNVGKSFVVNSGAIRVGGAGSNYVVVLGADLPVTLADPGWDWDPPAPRVHGVYVGIEDGVKTASLDEYRARIVVCEDTGGGTPTPPSTIVAYAMIATITIKPNHGPIQNADIDNWTFRRHGGSAGEYIAPVLDGNIWVSAGEPGGTANFRAQYRDGVVRLGGSIKRKDNNVIAGDKDYDIGTMHSNLRPTRVRYMTCATSINKTHTEGKTGTYTCRLRIDPDGTMTIAMPGGNSPTSIMFDGVTYDLDGDSL